MLRMELRRNAMPWILPLIAALFWFDSYRPSAATPPIWVLRTFWNMGQGHTIIDFGPFVAGVAAWMGSRDGRRGTTDLVTATPRPRYAAQLATWAATATWAVGAYLAFVGVLFAVYAYEGVHGSPPWWWVAVGAAGVTAFSAAGFTIGALYRSRFAAALAAFGGFLVMTMSSQTGFGHTSGWALILPTNSNGNYQPVVRDLLPLPARPADRQGDLPGRNHRGGAQPARPAGRRRRPAAAAGRRGGRPRRPGRDRDGHRAGRHRQARAARHGHRRPCTTRRMTGPSPTPRSAATPPGSPVCLNPAYAASWRT